jgi:hypothetical protein
MWQPAPIIGALTGDLFRYSVASMLIIVLGVIGTNKNTVITEPFEGIIDDVVLYSRALLASAIASLAAGGSPYTFK